LGWILIIKERWKEAFSYCHKAHERYSEGYSYTANLGHLYLLTGETNKAHVFYKKAMLQYPDIDTFEKETTADLELFIRNGWKRRHVAEQ